MPSSTKFMELTIGLILIFKATASNLITVLLILLFKSSGITKNSIDF